MSKRQKKTRKGSGKESTPKVEGWWNMAEPLGEYLPKNEGLNYYLLLDDGVYSEGEIEGRKVENVEFNAEYLELTDIKGRELKDSPEESLEGTLSIPMSLARKIRAKAEELEISVSDLEGKVLMIQRTGEKIKTRYPTVEIINQEDYFVD